MTTEFFYTFVAEAALVILILIAIALAATLAARRRDARYGRMAKAVDETLREASLAALVGATRAEAIRKGHNLRDGECRYHDPSGPTSPMTLCVVCVMERA